jgi:REP element-mobilizing transposase RayT
MRRRPFHARSQRAASGLYFVTLCTWNRVPLFGSIRDGTTELSPAGNIVADTWQWLPRQYEYLRLDEWCVMPDHLHGIIRIQRGEPPPKSLGRLIGAFKTVSTKRINELRKTPAALVWQRDYWDRSIRSPADLERVREYIRTNPRRFDTRPDPSILRGR